MSFAAQLKQLHDVLNQSRGVAYSAGVSLFVLLKYYVESGTECVFSWVVSALAFVIYDICEVFPLEVSFVKARPMGRSI